MADLLQGCAVTSPSPPVMFSTSLSGRRAAMSPAIPTVQVVAEGGVLYIPVPQHSCLQPAAVQARPAIPVDHITSPRQMPIAPQAVMQALAGLTDQAVQAAPEGVAEAEQAMAAVEQAGHPMAEMRPAMATIRAEHPVQEAG